MRSPWLEKDLGIIAYTVGTEVDAYTSLIFVFFAYIT